MVNGALNILRHTSDEFIIAADALGINKTEALTVYRKAFRHGISDVDWAGIHCAPISKMLHEHGAIKFTQPCGERLETESVILPITSKQGGLRRTLCVSSQIGCAMGCTFCETAQMGFLKNLTHEQIVGQWFAARFHSNDTHHIGKSLAESAITNIVFMGMGEPMDNLDEVIHAIRVLTDRNGASIASGRISVSTVGRAEGIRRLAGVARTQGFHKLRLAVSINGSNDQVRSSIMPINRATPMAELMQAMLEWPTSEKVRVLIEYVLIPSVNDSLDHARELCEYLQPLRCTVNVIPYNPRRDSPWPAPSEDSVRTFIQAVHEQGQFVKRRQTLGRSVMAACGQLGNPLIRRRKFVSLNRS
jgi:23S rRNA (adenine2503-C2)-methyltransferase